MLKELALSKAVKLAALRIGFDACGIAAAGKTPRMDLYAEAIAQGRHGEMSYLSRHFGTKSDIRRWLPGARSVIVCAASYHHGQQNPETGGIVARYARGRDYHKVLPKRLMLLVAEIERMQGKPFAHRVFCDAQPVHERVWAALAGIGWMGKNTLILNRALGSYFFLCGIVTELRLAVDSAVKNYCGACRKCLDACPTKALFEPYKMDARRCLSYLTIEHRGEVAPELAAKMGRRAFGCDICQEVCPWNSKAKMSVWSELGRGRAEELDLRMLAEMTEEERAGQFRGTALMRTKLPMWHRTARIILDQPTP